MRGALAALNRDSLATPLQFVRRLGAISAAVVDPAVPSRQRSPLPAAARDGGTPTKTPVGLRARPCEGDELLQRNRRRGDARSALRGTVRGPTSTSGRRCEDHEPGCWSSVVVQRRRIVRPRAPAIRSPSRPSPNTPSEPTASALPRTGRGDTRQRETRSRRPGDKWRGRGAHRCGAGAALAPPSEHAARFRRVATWQRLRNLRRFRLIQFSSIGHLGGCMWHAWCARRSRVDH